MARFLAEDRVKARQDVDRNCLAETAKTVANHRCIHEENMDKSLDELKAKRNALQPKLEELRRLRVHIENALSAMASQVADQMIQSFDLHMEERVRKPLPAAVDEFDLGRVNGLFVTFDATLDILRPEGKKFREAVTAHLQTQIADYLRPRVFEWVNTIETTFLRNLADRVESELKEEARVYAGILGEIGESIGGPLKGLSIEEILKGWITDFGRLNPDIVDTGMDLAPLMGGIVADVTLHMSAHLLPGVGVIVSAILMLWRRNRMQAKVRKQILEGMNNQLVEFALLQHEAIRGGLRGGVAKLENAIGGKIQEQIAQIDGDLHSLIEQKESREADASTRRGQLEVFQKRVNKEVDTILALLTPSHHMASSIQGKHAPTPYRVGPRARRRRR